MFRAENKLSLASHQCYEQFSVSALLCLSGMGLYTQNLKFILSICAQQHTYLSKGNFWCFQILLQNSFGEGFISRAESIGFISKIRISNQLGFFFLFTQLLIRGPWNAVFGCLFLNLQPSTEDRRICFFATQKAGKLASRSQAIKIHQKQFSQLLHPRRWRREYLIE